MRKTISFSDISQHYACRLARGNALFTIQFTVIIHQGGNTPPIKIYPRWANYKIPIAVVGLLWGLSSILKCVLGHTIL